MNTGSSETQRVHSLSAPEPGTPTLILIVLTIPDSADKLHEKALGIWMRQGSSMEVLWLAARCYPRLYTFCKRGTWFEAALRPVCTNTRLPCLHFAISCLVCCLL